MPGFIPYSRASLMLDLVVVAMVVIVPVLLWSIHQVRHRRRYARHRRVQLGIGVTLLAAVVLFELDMRVSGWRHLAEPSRFYQSLVFPALWVHLVFAVSACLTWVYTITMALRRFGPTPAPNAYSPAHRLVARVAAGCMIMTAVTGWVFYVLAFVA